MTNDTDRLDATAPDLMTWSRAASEFIQGYLYSQDSTPDLDEVRRIFDNLTAAIRATAQADRQRPAPRLDGIGVAGQLGRLHDDLLNMGEYIARDVIIERLLNINFGGAGTC